jgi:Carboxypeptidase regulatory-like domain
MTFRRFFLKTVLLALAAMATTSSLLGQANSLLTGTVVDPSGAVVVNAEVACRNTQTGVINTRNTNADGLFRFPDLPIGEYELTVTSPGFEPLTRKGLTLLTGYSVDVHLRLEVGTARQAVEVNAPASTVQPTSSELQTSIDSRSMRELPLNGRNPLQLVMLTAGAIDAGGGGSFQAANNQLAVNGNRATDNTFELDGLSYTDVHFGSAPILPNPDALQEFTVKSSNFAASQTGAGASVQFSTRSGTNQFHGSVFEFLRNNNLDARNFFAASAIPFKRNQFGGAFGGPVIKDKTFFFGSYQGTRVRGGANPAIMTLASEPLRRGDFSSLAKTIVDPQTGQPFPGNTIPSSRIDSIAQKLLPFIPVPNVAGGTALVPTKPHTDQDDDQFSLRGDHNFSARDHLTARYFYDKYKFQQSSSPLPGFLGYLTYTNQSIIVSETHTFSPNLLFVGSFGRTTVPRVGDGGAVPVTMQQLGANVPPALPNLLPQIQVTINGYSAPNSGTLVDVQPSTYEYRGRFTWMHGRHMLQFGADVLRNREYALAPAQAQGVWTYDGSRSAAASIRNSGDSYADFLLGLPFTFKQQGASPQDITETHWNPWIQDDWKVLPRLTLNLGLRWEPWLPAIDSVAPQVGFIAGVQSKVAPNAPTGLVFSGDPGLRHSIFRTDWNNLAPRVGFAWDLAGSGRTVFRGAYGVFYRPVGLNIQRFSSNTAAFRNLVITISNPPSTANPFAGYPGGDPFPAWVPATSLKALGEYQFQRPVGSSGLYVGTRTSYTQTWNFVIERQIRSDLALSLAYIGNHMVKGTSSTEGNPALYGPGATAANVNARRPYAGIGSLQMVTDFEHSTYHGAQIVVTRRMGRGLNLLGNYTYSKCMDNNTLTTGVVSVINKLDPNKDTARCDFDITHLSNVSLEYDLPDINSLKGVPGRLINHWRLSSILVFRTGTHFAVTSGRDNALSGPTNNSGTNDLADQISAQSGRPAGVDQLAKWFNTAAYVQNAPGTFGNSGRNSLTAPGAWNWDFGLVKNFPITETVQAGLRFEAFNLLNHANFNTPSSVLTSPNFGSITTASSPRVLQLALRMSF